MSNPGFQMWRWLIFACLGWLCSIGQVTAGPQYMVAIPALIEAGSESKLCASLLDPNETLVMTVTMISTDKNATLLQETIDTEFHRCVLFKAPTVQDEKIQAFQVEVKGTMFFVNDTRNVLIQAYNPQTFIQTDKPIYLPGQTVHFRIITLDSQLRPVDKLYKLTEFEDSNGNIIGQWLNTTSKGKMVQLSYVLNLQAPEGLYNITVWLDDKSFLHAFKVMEYVLPKFAVTVKCSKEISIGQDEFKTEVCAKYTYGAAVSGSVHMHVSRPFDPYAVIPKRVTPEHPEGIPAITIPFYNERKRLEASGCATFTIQLEDFTRVNNVFLGELTLVATVEEEGTGINYSEVEPIQISYIVGKLSFIDTPMVYEKGSVVEGKVKAVYFNDTPISDKMVYVFKGARWSAQLLYNLTTDSNGIASFSINTKIEESIELTASINPKLDYPDFKTPFYEEGSQILSLARPATAESITISSLKVANGEKLLLCGREEKISIQYAFVGEEQGSLSVIYLILSRASIVQQGHLKVEINNGPVTDGEVSFMLEVSPEMAPLVQVVAYAVLPSENVIAHSADFETEKCFRHKVSLEFSPSKAVPGEESILQLSALPGSLCGLSIVDMSVNIMQPGNEITADKIFDLLPAQKASFIPHQVQDPDLCLQVRTRRYIMPYPGPQHGGDAYTVFEGLGLKMFTNLMIRYPSCLSFKGRDYYAQRLMWQTLAKFPAPAQVVAQAPTPASPGIVETVRTFFPETWIWDLAEVGETGAKEIPVTVPDTITTWESEAFCLSPQGFGLAPPKDLTVFQPFFLELSLPYSIIRGEHFVLKATVFNYLSSCIMVTVSPSPSLDYTLTPLCDLQPSCLCANGHKTFQWTMEPSILGVVNITMKAEAVTSQVSCDNEVVSVLERGRIDVVTRSLIVQAEGIKRAKNYNYLLCPKGETLTEHAELQVPDNVIDGSARATVSVLGDILGRALQNLDGLLQMPYGCGEQNMALLAPNIYILEYLTNTKQLTPAIKEKATQFLTSGYQNELNYKNSEGAYSTFAGETGNTWLTAFVLRSFDKAKSFIYIDPKIITSATTWLEGKQKRNGCFQQSGTLYHNAMKGGVSDEVTLSAYITAAFLEMHTSPSHSVNSSLSCLKESIGDMSNTYTTALLAYVFTLAGDMETRARLLQHLDTVAIQQGGFLHWSQKSSETSSSLSVEISSYVLLATLSASSPTTADVGYASRIVRWLTSQQNHYGGFSSTQDTVVALQALALYATLVYSPEGSSVVTVQSPSGQLTFDVNQDNKLLYQEKQLPDVTGKYSVEVTGTACASIQVSLSYNIPPPPAVHTLKIQVTPECNASSVGPKLTLKLESLFSGKENTTNMVIVDLKILSGFVPDPTSISQLTHAMLVARVDQDEDHVIVYLQELPSGIPIYQHLDLVQQYKVQSLKPAVVEIYDYYQPSDRAETEYTYPCAAGT